MAEEIKNTEEQVQEKGPTVSEIVEDTSMEVLLDEETQEVVFGTGERIPWPEDEEERHALVRDLIRQGYGKEEREVALGFKAYLEQLEGDEFDSQWEEAVKSNSQNMLSVLAKKATPKHFNQAFELLEKGKVVDREDYGSFREHLLLLQEDPHRFYRD